MTRKSNKNSAAKKSESPANVVLPGEMRLLLDSAQEKLDKTSWTDTVQWILKHFVESENRKENDGFAGLKEIEEIKESAVEKALERIVEALDTAFKSADLKIDKRLLKKGLDSAAANSNPTDFAEFMTKFLRQIEQADSRQKESANELKNVTGALKNLEERLEKIEQAMLKQNPPQIIINNADADADADADGDADADSD